MTLQPIRTQPVAASRLIACLLAFSAGLLVLTSGLAWAYLNSQPGAGETRAREAPVAATDSVALVEQFYGAVNDAIATGDTTGLSDLVDPAFADHPARIGVPDGRDGLIQTVLAIHATVPLLRIVLDSVVPSNAGDEMTVRLHTAGVDTGAFLGFSLPDETQTWGWGPLELLRVANGRIAERWSGQEPAAMLEPLAESDPLPGGDSASLDIVALLRLTIAPEATARFTTALQAQFLVVETGTVSAGILGPEVQNATIRKDAYMTGVRALAAGDETLVPPKSSVEIVNDGGDPASLLLVVRHALGNGLASPDGNGGPAQSEATAIARSAPEGVTAIVLSAGVIPPGNEVSVALGRVTMPAGSTLTWRPGPTVLFALDAGELSLSTDDVRTEGTRANGERWFDDDTTLETGDGAYSPAGSGFTWRNPSSAPAQLLFLSLTVE